MNMHKRVHVCTCAYLAYARIETCFTVNNHFMLFFFFVDMIELVSGMSIMHINVIVPQTKLIITTHRTICTCMYMYMYIYVHIIQTCIDVLGPGYSANDLS